VLKKEWTDRQTLKKGECLNAALKIRGVKTTFLLKAFFPITVNHIKKPTKQRSGERSNIHKSLLKKKETGGVRRDWIENSSKSVKVILFLHIHPSN
jgi:hypothetical protein